MNWSCCPLYLNFVFFCLRSLDIICISKRLHVITLYLQGQKCLFIEHIMVSMFHIFSLLFCLQTFRFSGYRSLFSPQTMAGYTVIIETPRCQTVWTAAKESISWTYMNVYGLLNCFRHTVRWALRFAKSHTASQGQEGRQRGATVSQSWANPALSITLPLLDGRALIKDQG